MRNLKNTLVAALFVTSALIGSGCSSQRGPEDSLDATVANEVEASPEVMTAEISAVLALHRAAINEGGDEAVHASLTEEQMQILNKWLAKVAGDGCKIIGYDGCGGSDDCKPVRGKDQQKVWLSKDCPKTFICTDCG